MHVGHMDNDMLPFYYCCTGEVFKSCNYFYDRRPNDNCEDWPERPPPGKPIMLCNINENMIARTFGDPHLVTLDGYQYTFNGHGEFTMIQSIDESLRIQVRMIEPPITTNGSNMSSSGTVITAIVAKHNESDTVQFEANNNGQVIAMVNGDLIDFKQLSELQYHNLTLNNVGNGVLTATLSTGVSVTVKGRNGMLYDLSVTLPEHYYNNAYGLLGQYNGNSEDDLYPKNGDKSLPSNSSLRDIHNQFGLSC